MDQLQPAIAFFKKHYFWLLCALTVVLALGVWEQGRTADLGGTIASRATRLSGEEPDGHDP